MELNRKIGKNPDIMSRPLDKNGSEQTTKESRDGETPKPQKRGGLSEMGGRAA